MDSTELRIGFAGTPEFAARHLTRLLETGHRIECVYTQPDRRGGRGNRVLPSAVKQVAQAAELDLRQPANFKQADTVDALRRSELDLLIVVAYGLLLPDPVLQAPRLGCINVHASLLPRWRGAAPIQRAIEAGDTETGITIMQMDAGLDTGDMLHKVTVPINDEDTAATLHDRLLAVGPEALVDALAGLAAGSLNPEVQDDSLACYARKLDPAESPLDWGADALTLARKIRALNPFPVCSTYINNYRVKIWLAEPEAGNDNQAPGTILQASKSGIRVACGKDCLRLTQLQLPGGRAMPAADMLNSQGELLAPGKQFTPTPDSE